MMSINAVKGVEIGTGFAAAALSGEENADEMRHGSDGPVFSSIMPVACWVAFPPARDCGALCRQTDFLYFDAAQKQFRKAVKKPTLLPKDAMTPAWGFALCRSVKR